MLGLGVSLRRGVDQSGAESTLFSFSSKQPNSTHPPQAPASCSKPPVGSHPVPTFPPSALGQGGLFKQPPALSQPPFLRWPLQSLPGFSHRTCCVGWFVYLTNVSLGGVRPDSTDPSPYSRGPGKRPGPAAACAHCPCRPPSDPQFISHTLISALPISSDASPLPPLPQAEHFGLRGKAGGSSGRGQEIPGEGAGTVGIGTLGFSRGSQRGMCGVWPSECERRLPTCLCSLIGPEGTVMTRTLQRA